MVQELFSNVLGGLRDATVHLSNANPITLVLVVLGIAVVGYLLLRR